MEQITIGRVKTNMNFNHIIAELDRVNEQSERAVKELEDLFGYESRIERESEILYMEIHEDITINFSENETKEIIAEFLRRKGYECTSKNIYFSIGTELRGYGMSKYETTVFKGCTANVRK